MCVGRLYRGSNLTIASVRLTDDGDYVCTVTDPQCTSRTVITVTVAWGQNPHRHYHHHHHLFMPWFHVQFIAAMRCNFLYSNRRLLLPFINTVDKTQLHTQNTNSRSHKIQQSVFTHDSLSINNLNVRCSVGMLWLEWGKVQGGFQQGFPT